jgi:hypothetical protein
MYKFHITGYAGFHKNDSQIRDDLPVDITVISDTLNNAIDEAERVIGFPISITYRKVTIEACRNTLDIRY